MTETTLAEDEAVLASYALNLSAEVRRLVPVWVRQAIARLAAGHASDSAIVEAGDRAVHQCEQRVLAPMDKLLMTDIDSQTSNPLSLLRGAAELPTEQLQLLGVPVVQRDRFAIERFPDDVYDLTPASFADIGAELHEPGLVWGAAKAHVHLRRRREVSAKPRVVALCVDLMDKSKLSAAWPDAEFVRSAGQLSVASADATYVFVDLTRPGALEAVAELDGAALDAEIIGYGPHVDEALLSAAKEAGCHEVLPRSVFFRRLAGS